MVELLNARAVGWIRSGLTFNAGDSSMHRHPYLLAQVEHFLEDRSMDDVSNGNGDPANLLATRARSGIQFVYLTLFAVLPE